MVTRKVKIGVSTIGFVASELTTLRGYDVMALELLQNADDSDATFLEFHLSDEELVVKNNSLFISCSDRAGVSCFGRDGDPEELCDWHRFREIASGNKSSKNIGRFGVGFVSVYQVTDHPSVSCDGTTLKIVDLRKGDAEFDDVEIHPGTVFRLPWAFDPSSDVRLGVKCEALKVDDLDQIAQDIADSVSQSLLFLRHVTKVSVFRNSRLIVSGEIEVISENEKRVTLGPERRVERWFTAKGSAASALEEVESEHPFLLKEGRKKDIEIAIPIVGDRNLMGLIYAYLPTQRQLGFQMHVNADFWPESSRKDIIFPSGSSSDPQSLWNYTLIVSAARLLAENVPGLFSLLKEVNFWHLVRGTHETYSRSRDETTSVPISFGFFWIELMKVLPNFELVISEDGSNCFISEALIVDSENAPARRKVLQSIGLRAAGKTMNQFFDLLVLLGAVRPSLELVVQALLNSAWGKEELLDTEVSTEEIESQYEPLWGLLESLLPREEDEYIVQELIPQIERLPIFLTSQNRPTSLIRCFSSTIDMDLNNLKEVMPHLTFLSDHTATYPKILKLSKRFTLVDFAQEVTRWLGLLPKLPLSEIEKIKKLHLSLRQLTHNRTISPSDIDAIKSIEFWPSLSGGLLSCRNGKIPGNFLDPLGSANLIDLRKIDTESADFLRNRLSIEKLDIKNYVTDILPGRFSTPTNSVSVENYRSLLIELSKHPDLFSDRNCKLALQKMNLIKTIDGRYSEAINSVYHNKEAEILLGEYFGQWVDDAVLPRGKMVEHFLDDLGVQKRPNAFQVVTVWKALVMGSSPKESKERIQAILRYIMTLRKDWRPDDLRAELLELKGMPCLPAQGEELLWHAPNRLYGPTWADAFSSQTKAKVLGFTTPNRDEILFLVNELGLRDEPEDQLVVDHLKFESSRGHSVSSRVYEFLNSVADRKMSALLIRSLKNYPCIYLENNYFKPSQLYREDPKIGKPWTIKIPENFYKSYSKLFEALEISSRPSAHDILMILRELMEQYKDKSPGEVDAIGNVHYWCWHELNRLFLDERVDQEVLASLKRESLLLSVSNKFELPSRLLVSDSDWFSERFDKQFDDYLVRDKTAAPDLFIELGITLVSASIEISLGKVEGERKDSFELKKLFSERHKNYGVVLASLNSTYDYKEIWNGISVYFVDSIELLWTLPILQRTAPDVRTSSQIFFDIRKKELYLVKREQVEWVLLFREMLLQLFPAEIDKVLMPLAPLLASLIDMTAPKGRNHLAQSGYIFADKLDPIEPAITSSEVDYVVDSQPTKEIDQDPPKELPENNGSEFKTDKISSISGKPTKESVGIEDLISAKRPAVTSTMPTIQNENDTLSNETLTDDGNPPRPREPIGNHGSPVGVRHPSRPTSPSNNDHTALKYTSNQQPVRKAFIYIEGQNEEQGRETLAIRLEIEKIARQFVMADEERMGRIPEEMPLDNKGYDIESTEKDSNDLRFIEIKSLAGSWGARGVSLTQAQMNWAYAKKDAYWIYVVENVRTPNPWIFRINNPAKYIAGFKFNDAWKEFDSEIVRSSMAGEIQDIEESDAGQRINHSTHGQGWLLEIKSKGVGQLVKIDFDGAGEMWMAWNPSTMKLI